jgi:hypothetical protein
MSVFSIQSPTLFLRRKILLNLLRMMVEVWKIFVFLSPSTTQPTLDLRVQNSSSSLRVKLSSSLRDLSSFTLDLEECKAKAVWTPLILVKTRLFSEKYYQK